MNVNNISHNDHIHFRLTYARNVITNLNIPPTERSCAECYDEIPEILRSTPRFTHFRWDSLDSPHVDLIANETRPLHSWTQYLMFTDINVLKDSL